jgi:L-2-hydroxyglutarate oxidase LhgO
MPRNDFDITIIGAGVVGLAIAARLSAVRKNKSILLLERNTKYGMETSSRNSEVIHAGMYYEPGSLKARFCVEGRDELYALCRDHGIAHKQITKIIVAGIPAEVPKLEVILKRGTENGAGIRMLDETETHALEPNITAVASIYSPLTGILSAHELMDYLYHSSVNNGVVVQHRCEVEGIEKTGSGYSLTIRDSGGVSAIGSECVVNAAGLFSDRIAAQAGIDIDESGYRIRFCKGSYFSVTSDKARLLTRLVYPVPGNEFLGVHALFDLAGRLRFGPDVEYMEENKLDYTVAASKLQVFLESIQRILPSVTAEDIAPDMCGIRPKLQPPGGKVQDFVIVHEKERGLEGFVNLIGIESPGLTASPAIARYVEKLLFA